MTTPCTVVGMGWWLLLLLVLGMVGLGVFWNLGRKKREAQALADAREEAQRWYERLGGQIMNLPSGDDASVKQALVDAGERYNAAGSQLERATTLKQYELAKETALEGLAYVRAARTALGLDPGPDLPPLAGQRAAGAITEDREVDLQGHRYRASPNPGNDTPYYYPGGRVGGRPVPSGWYSQPLWKTALVAGAGTVGGLLLFDALFSPDLGHDAGFQDGVEYADAHDGDGGDGDGGDGGDGDYGDGGYDASYDGGDYGGGDFGGDFGADF